MKIDFEKLIKKHGHKEVMIALIIYEKDCSKETATKLYNDWEGDPSTTSMISDYFWIGNEDHDN